jgi:hypothetical protein
MNGSPCCYPLVPRLINGSIHPHKPGRQILRSWYSPTRTRLLLSYGKCDGIDILFRYADAS